MSADAPLHPFDDRMSAMTGRRRPPPLEMWLAATVDSVPTARHRLARWLAAARVERETCDELALVITELTTNAVEASPSPTAHIGVVAVMTDGEVMVSVSDAGRGLDMAKVPELPDRASIRGRGLPIVSALMDRVAVERADGRTEVMAVRALRT